MSYKYETHLHTREGSACGKSTAIEMVRAHKEAGYDGIFVTDHFFNGNCAVDKTLPWKEKVELFCKGYENAKAEGDKCGLKVFFGFEYGVQAADFLIYNLDKKWLLEHPDIDKMHAKTAFWLMRQDGGFIVHAHPFRERDYIDHIQLFPRDVDGVEVRNGGQKDDLWMNDRAKLYAMMYELPMTAGSDVHVTEKIGGCGILTETPIEEPLDYLNLMRDGKLRLF